MQSEETNSERGTVRTIRTFAKARKLRFLKGPFGRQGVEKNKDSPAEEESKQKGTAFERTANHSLSEENGKEKEACVSLLKREHWLLEMDEWAGCEFFAVLAFGGEAFKSFGRKNGGNHCGKNLERLKRPVDERKRWGNREERFPNKILYSVCLHQRKSSDYSPGK